MFLPFASPLMGFSPEIGASVITISCLGFVGTPFPLREGFALWSLPYGNTGAWCSKPGLHPHLGCASVTRGDTTVVSDTFNDNWFPQRSQLVLTNLCVYFSFRVEKGGSVLFMCVCVSFLLVCVITGRSLPHCNSLTLALVDPGVPIPDKHRRHWRCI